MTGLRRASFAGFALVFGASLAALGCDAGGLLVAQGSAPGEAPPVKGHSSTEIVNGGTLAKNAKYKMFYVLGQPSPQQGVASAPGVGRLNGGLTGAVQGE